MAKSKTAAAEKAACPISRAQFAKAKPFMASINGSPVAVTPKEFATGTLGWFANGKVVIEVDGVPVNASYMVQVFVPNSKDAE